MKPKAMMVGLALVLATMVGWAVGVVVGQPNLQPANGQPMLAPGQDSPSPYSAQVQPAAMPMQSEGQMPVVRPGTPMQVQQGAPMQVQQGEPASVTSSPTPVIDNPTGRQEPAVSLEWIGPASAKVGQPVTYQVIVKNISPTQITGVMLKVQMPTGAKINAAEPKATMDGDHMTWQLGTLEPREDKRVDIQMVPEATGQVQCNATVTLSAQSIARLQVSEPKLQLKAQGPEKVIMGDPATITLVVSNPGDATADHVKVMVNLGEGLEHARGKQVEFDVGNLRPRESRSIQVVCAAKGAGVQKCEAVATAEPGLMSQDSANVEILQPQVALEVHGPKMRYLDRPAIFTLKVTNPGSAPATNVSLVDQVPQGFKFVSATSEGRHDFVSRTVYWQLGDIPAGQTKEVNLELVAINAGEHKNKAVVTAARGLKDEQEAMTTVMGVSALLMELVDLDDPVELGYETSYEVRVTNTGTKTETNVQLVCTLPDKMEFRGARAPAGAQFKMEGHDVVFDPLPRLAPRADAIYRINVKGLAAGDMRFRARIKADGLTEPVLKEESTKVYGDEVGPK